MQSDQKQEIRVHIRWMIRRDMPEVLDVERSSFEFPWAEDDFIRCLRQRNCIGMVAEVDDQRFVVADIPGLIEGASEGAGLGDRFLRHIERTRVLVHLVDVGTPLLEERDPLADWETIRTELTAYGAKLEERPVIVVFNKVDLLPDRTVLDALIERLKERSSIQSVELLSGATGEGVREVLRAIAVAVAAGDGEAAA